MKNDNSYCKPWNWNWSSKTLSVVAVSGLLGGISELYRFSTADFRDQKHGSLLDISGFASPFSTVNDYNLKFGDDNDCILAKNYYGKEESLLAYASREDITGCFDAAAASSKAGEYSLTYEPAPKPLEAILKKNEASNPLLRSKLKKDPHTEKTINVTLPYCHYNGENSVTVTPGNKGNINLPLTSNINLIATDAKGAHHELPCDKNEDGTSCSNSEKLPTNIKKLVATHKGKAFSECQLPKPAPTPVPTKPPTNPPSPPPTPNTPPPTPATPTPPPTQQPCAPLIGPFKFGDCQQMVCRAPANVPNPKSYQGVCQHGGSVVTIEEDRLLASTNCWENGETIASIFFSSKENECSNNAEADLPLDTQKESTVTLEG